MAAKLTDSPAFPGGNASGMTYRQWLAGLCLQGILLKNSNSNIQDPQARAACVQANVKLALEHADALMTVLGQ
jgi:hypothetical protein